MPNPVPPPFPAQTTAPKYTPPSMITPMPHIPPSGEMKQAKGLGAASFLTATAGVLFWIVKEAGGVPATMQWLRNLPPLGLFCLSVVFIVAAGVVFGVQVLRRMDQDRVESRQLTEFRDQRQTDMMNEMVRTQAHQSLRLERVEDRLEQIHETIEERLPAAPASPSADTPIQRRSGTHERIREDDTPPETPTGRQRRIAGR